MLGDSMTEGFGVEMNETFSSLLQEKLGDKFEVINAGVKVGVNVRSANSPISKWGVAVKVVTSTSASGAVCPPQALNINKKNRTINNQRCFITCQAFQAIEMQDSCQAVVF